MLSIRFFLLGFIRLYSIIIVVILSLNILYRTIKTHINDINLILNNQFHRIHHFLNLLNYLYLFHFYNCLKIPFYESVLILGIINISLQVWDLFVFCSNDYKKMFLLKFIIFFIIYPFCLIYQQYYFLINVMMFKYMIQH